jgi:hypothetical protein
MLINGKVFEDEVSLCKAISEVCPGLLRAYDICPAAFHTGLPPDFSILDSFCFDDMCEIFHTHSCAYEYNLSRCLLCHVDFWVFQRIHKVECEGSDSNTHFHVWSGYRLLSEHSSPGISQINGELYMSQFVKRWMNIFWYDAPLIQGLVSLVGSSWDLA